MSIAAVIWMTKQKTGDSASKSLLFWLAWHLNDESGLCYPSLNTLQSEMEVGSVNTVRSAVERLVKAGLIAVENERSKGGKIVKTCYRLIGFKPSVIDTSTNDLSTIDISTIDRSNTDVSTIDGSLYQPLTDVVSTIDSNNKEKEKEDINGDAAKASSSPATASPVGGASRTMLLSEAFASLPDFWRQYAEKVRPDLNPELTFTNFSFYWTQGKGAGKRRSVRGWTSTWQTWVRNERAVSASVSAAPTNGYGKIKRTPEEEAKAIAASKAYWERYRAEQEKQKSQTADRFDQAMAFDDEKEAEKQISIALGSSGLVKVIRGKR